MPGWAGALAVKQTRSKHMSTKKTPAKKDAKGGSRTDGWTNNNHNETLVGDPRS